PRRGAGRAGLDGARTLGRNHNRAAALRAVEGFPQQLLRQLKARRTAGATDLDGHAWVLLATAGRSRSAWNAGPRSAALIPSLRSGAERSSLNRTERSVDRR